MSDQVRVEMTGHGKGRVWVNGVEVHALSIEFVASPDNFNLMRIEFSPAQVEIIGLADVIPIERDSDELEAAPFKDQASSVSA